LFGDACRFLRGRFAQLADFFGRHPFQLRYLIVRQFNFRFQGRLKRFI
jgi:hypothetical protein